VKTLRHRVLLTKPAISQLVATALLLATSIAIVQSRRQSLTPPGSALATSKRSAVAPLASSPAGAIETPRRLRKIAPEVVAPPELPATQLWRLEARPPLGDLGLALPLDLRPDTWRPTRILRPVAMTSALIHGERHKVAVHGVRSPDAGLICQDSPTSRPCADLSREALQAWLAKNVLTCDVPKSARAAVSTTCSSGRQDLGAWLVSNGWGIAQEDGPYVNAEQVATKAKMGIFAYQLRQPGSGGNYAARNRKPLP
jgi:endonuclease YncB( thermonuclease family)